MSKTKRASAQTTRPDIKPGQRAILWGRPGHPGGVVVSATPNGSRVVVRPDGYRRPVAYVRVQDRWGSAYRPATGAPGSLVVFRNRY